MHVVCGSPARAHLAYGCRHVSTSRTRKPDVTTRRERHRAGGARGGERRRWWEEEVGALLCSARLHTGCGGSGGRSVVISST